MDGELDDDPWPAIRQNYVFLSHKLRLERILLGSLYEQCLISKDDFKMLRDDSISEEEKITRLLLDILPSRPSTMFATFCDILRSVDQPHIADQLTKNPQEVQLFSKAQGICPLIYRACVLPGINLFLLVQGLQNFENQRLCKAR